MPSHGATINERVTSVKITPECDRWRSGHRENV